MAFTALDIIVFVAVIAGAAFGVMRGFVAEVLSLFAWFLSIAALRYLYEPVSGALVRPVGTESGAGILAFVLIFGSVFILGKIASRRVGKRVRQSIVGSMDRALGGGFGALKGLLGATLLFMGFTLITDTISFGSNERPRWIAEARSYGLLESSRERIIGFVGSQRGPTPPTATGNSAR
jgi:membrane protein required for colicin V production